MAKKQKFLPSSWLFRAVESRKVRENQKNYIKNVFSNLKLTLENIMDHWNDLVWSIFEKVQKDKSDARFGGGTSFCSPKNVFSNLNWP